MTVEAPHLASYAIRSELGSGGMGKVYLAEVTERAAGLEAGTKVALKIIHPHLLETPGFFKRFLREAEVGKAVQQENVVQTYDCDAVLKNGVHHHFLVMEYVEGQTLRDLLQELGQVPEELCRHIAHELAMALAAIHAAGIVHRDLKPENALITKDHVVKVMDLGVARLQDEVIRLSQTGAFVGSVHYASPEQFRGGGEDLDGRADLHALGVLLYELASGRHPFQDDDMTVVLSRILTEEPQRLGERNPQLSPFFEEVVHKLLAKDRDARFTSAEELIAVLEEGEASAWWKERARALRLKTRKPLRRIRVPRESAVYGRDEELAQLQTIYGLVKEGQGQVVLIEGEAGIGRTRMVDEFVARLQRAGEDLNFLFGSYPPAGAATAAGAFSTAYREQFGTEGLEETLRSYVTQSPLLIPSFAALLRGEPPPTGGEPLTKDSVQTVFVQASQSLARERPTLILIDDLHHAPEEGRALFASLALGVPGHRLMLIGTTRRGRAEEWAASVERLEHSTRMALSRLGPKDVAQLILDVFRSQRLADDLGFQIVMKSDGNPFFVFEIIRSLREGGYLTKSEDGSWVSTKEIQDIKIPSSVMDLIESRVIDLSEEEREILEVAACAGYEFDPALVADALGIPIVPALKRFARIEKKHRLIRSEGRRYIFDHHQIQQALHEGLFEQLSEQYHLALAEALERREKAAGVDPKSLRGAVALDLCQQFFDAGRPERAIRYLDTALDCLEAGYLNDDAISLAERALAVDDLITGEARVDLMLRRADRLGLVGRPHEQRQALDEALPLAESCGSAAAAARAGVSLGLHLHHVAKYDEACEALAAARERAREAGDRDLEAKAERIAGNARTTQGRLDEAQAHYERGIALAQAAGNLVEEGGSTNNLGNVANQRGDMEHSIELYERALEILQRTGYRVFENRVMGNLSIRYREQGRQAEARELRMRSLEMARSIGDRLGEVMAESLLGGDYAGEGRLEQGLAHTRRAVSLSLEIDVPDWRCSALLGLVDILIRLGALEEAGEQVARARELAADLGAARHESSALVSAAEVHLNSGECAEAQANLERALAIDRRSESPHRPVASLLALGRCYRAQERPERAAECLQEASRLAREYDLIPSLVTALSEAACLPGGDGREAATVLEAESHRIARTTRMHAHALLWQATRDGRHLEEARRLLAFMRQHAPAEQRDAMIENVPLHRQIMEASRAR